MNINDNQVKELKDNYNNLLQNDCHIYDIDNKLTVRQKDMIFGKIMAYQQIFEMLGIEY